MLEIKNLEKHFGGVHALKDVSLKVKESEVVAVVGDNGAGKSTLMKCISGALKPDTGSIVFNGQILGQGQPFKTREAGIEMIYQDLNLCTQQDVVSNVFLGRETTLSFGGILKQKTMRTACQTALTELGIDIPLKSIVGNLSGGQQQSVAIARAMTANPKLLIMDEPTAALGVKEVQKVLKHILSLKKKGIAVIMITHRLADIFEVADRIIVMRGGEIRHELSPKKTDLKDLTAKIIGA